MTINYDDSLDANAIDILMPEEAPLVDRSGSQEKTLTKKPVLIVEELAKFTHGEEGFFRNYFDLEGGTFPDLFSRDTKAKNDRVSTVKYVSTPRGPRMFGDLLTAVLTEKIRLENRERSKNGSVSLDKDDEARKTLLSAIIKKFVGKDSAISDSVEESLSREEKLDKE